MSAISELPAEDAVRAVMARLREAWERGDGQAYASLFSEDAQYVTAPGERMRGRKSIADSHQEIFNTFFKETKLGHGYPSSLRRTRRMSFWLSPPVRSCFPGRAKAKLRPTA
jgi:uncharacterized protein (TIGR02246 family)